MKIDSIYLGKLTDAIIYFFIDMQVPYTFLLFARLRKIRREHLQSFTQTREYIGKNLSEIEADFPNAYIFPESPFKPENKIAEIYTTGGTLQLEFKDNKCKDAKFFHFK